MFQVEQVMSKEITTIKNSANVYDAMILLTEKKVSGLPVVDEDEKLVGIISEKDMLRVLIEGEIVENRTVEKYMTSKVESFSPSDNIVDVSEFFAERPIRRVPILDDGKVVGIVSRRDIIKLILSLRGKSG